MHRLGRSGGKLVGIASEPDILEHGGVGKVDIMLGMRA
jgi:hypothetical protein